MRVICPHCLSVNNIPEKESYKKANCGKCKNSLLDTKPIELTDANFDEVVVNSVLRGKSLALSSKFGPITLQGPHHGAQKSTITGISLFTRTSSKFALLKSMGLVSKSDFLHFPQFAFL